MNVSLFLAADDASAVLGGGIYLVIFFGLLFVAIVWLVFPFIVVGKFNALIREVQNLRKELKIRRDEDKAGKEENAERPTPNVQSRMAEKPPSREAMAAKEVYKI